MANELALAYEEQVICKGTHVHLTVWPSEETPRISLIVVTKQEPL